MDAPWPEHPPYAPPTTTAIENSGVGGGGGVEEQGTWAAQKHSEAGYGQPVDRGVWTAKTVKRPRQQPAHPQYANYWAPLTRKRHTTSHSAQPQHTNYWAPRTRKRHQQEHRPQRPTESSDPTQHAKERTGDCPGPRKGATTRRNVTQGGLSGLYPGHVVQGSMHRASAIRSVRRVYVRAGVERACHAGMGPGTGAAWGVGVSGLWVDLHGPWLDPPGDRTDNECWFAQAGPAFGHWVLRFMGCPSAVVGRPRDADCLRRESLLS